MSNTTSAFRVLRFMHVQREIPFVAVLLSVALHALALTWVAFYGLQTKDPAKTPKPKDEVLFLEVVKPRPVKPQPPPPPPPVRPKVAPAPRATLPRPVAAPDAPRPVASMDAPPAPTAEEWAFAAKYTLKNSKGYRHSWGQQVRSQMGTAVEGPDQGLVRFRVEIAPDGKLAKLDTLWSTSPVAERRARQAVENMPPLPPTPTGKPLVFEKTISFSPFFADSPPVYKDDCLPDPPSFRNRYAWNGQGQPERDEQATETPDKPDPQSLADCQRLLPQDSIEAETGHDQRQLEQWRSMKLGR